MSASIEKKPLCVALLGAGIFSSTSHAPVIRGNPNVFNCIAVWSRRRKSAEELAATLDTNAYGDDDGLKEVLQLPGLEAVIIALPLDVQPKYVTLALQAGKHVLSEKPVAATVGEAQKLVQMYHQKYASLQWSIAENYRYEPAILRTVDAVKKEIGNPFLVSLTIRSPFRPDNKYLNTAWRNKPSWDGGLFIDALPHASAMLRMALGEAKSVSAVTSSRADYLPSPDTMTARVGWENGVQGVISVTYASLTPKFEFDVTGTEGSVVLQRRLDGPGYRLTVNDNDGENLGFGGIDGEFLAFAAACRGEQSDCNSPDEAVKDLAFIEACLQSGKNNGAITAVKV